MLDQKKITQAFQRIDGLLSRAKIVDPVLTRQDHILLVNDLNLIQACCIQYFEDQNERTNQPTEHVELGSENSKGSIDSVPGSGGDESSNAPDRP